MPLSCVWCGAAQSGTESHPVASSVPLRRGNSEQMWGRVQGSIKRTPEPTMPHMQQHHPRGVHAIQAILHTLSTSTNPEGGKCTRHVVHNVRRYASCSSSSSDVVPVPLQLTIRPCSMSDESHINGRAGHAHSTPDWCPARPSRAHPGCRCVLTPFVGFPSPQPPPSLHIDPRPCWICDATLAEWWGQGISPYASLTSRRPKARGHL